MPPISGVFSRTTVDRPAFDASAAPVSAPPPEPTTITSYSISETTGAPWHNCSVMSSPRLQITYPPELPVSQRRDDIAAAIRDHQVVIVAGETGSGKTTQLPKICLELGRGGPARAAG